MEKKYGTILTMLLVVIIVTIIGVGIYYGVDYLSGAKGEDQASKAVEEFNKATTERKKIVTQKTGNKKEEEENTTENTIEITDEMIESAMSGDSSNKGANGNGGGQTIQEPEKQYLEGYEVVGTIQIPKTSVNYPILSEVTKHSLETSVAVLYGPGVNQPGNTVIVGHNYRNSRFFSKNNTLTNGDTIVLTDVYGEVVTYVIYNMYYTTPDDADYMLRDVEEGVREISLSTCNEDSSQRLIIWAKEQGR